LDGRHPHHTRQSPPARRPSPVCAAVAAASNDAAGAAQRSSRAAMGGSGREGLDPWAAPLDLIDYFRSASTVVSKDLEPGILLLVTTMKRGH